MKKILFFLFILLSCSLFAQNPIPFGSPIQVKLKSPSNYLIGIQTAATVDTFTHGVGITGIYTIKNTANDICFNYNGGLSKCVSTLGTSSYVAGTGISISGTTLNASTTSALWNANQLQGRSIATTTPTSGNVLGWNGSVWLPTVSTSGSNYAAGTGLTLTTNTFTHTAHTGDATGSTSLTVVALQGRSIATTAPTSGSYLKYNGSAWEAANDVDYTAGNGISISGNTISAKLPDSNAIFRYWSDTITVTRVDTNTVSFYTSSNAKALQLSYSLIDHIMRWKSATDSIKCAVINTVTVSSTKVTIGLLGNYVLATDKNKVFAYTLYDKVSVIEFGASGAIAQDDSALVEKKYPTTGISYRIISGKADVKFGATGATASFAPNIYWKAGTTDPIFYTANLGTGTTRQFRVQNAYRVITGADKYWLSLRARVSAGTTTASTVTFKVYWIQNSLLNAN